MRGPLSLWGALAIVAVGVRADALLVVRTPVVVQTPVAVPELDVAVWGCEGWPSSDTCETKPPHRVVFHTPGRDAPLELTGPALIGVVSNRVVDGARVVTASVTAGAVDLHAGSVQRRLHVLPLVAEDPRAVLREVLDRRPLDVDRIHAELARTRGAESAARAAAEAAWARPERAAMRFDAALRAYETSAAEYVRLARPLEAARELATMACVAVSDSRLALAERALDEARAWGGHDLATRARIELCASVLADVRLELRGWQARVEWLAAHVPPGADTRLELAVQQAAANLQIRLGRVAAARKTFARLEALPGAFACERAAYAGQQAWLTWGQLDRGEITAPEAIAGMDAARRALALGCTDTDANAHAAVDLALLALEVGDVAQAHAAVALARANGAEAWGTVRGWLGEVDARIAESHGPPARASTLWDAHLRRAEAVQDHELTHHALVGAARWASARGQRDEALALGQRAHDLAARMLVRAAFGQGKQGYARAFERGSTELAERLIDAGALGAALAVVRETQARPLRELAAGATVERLDPAALTAYRKTVAEVETARGELWQLPVAELATAAAHLAAEQQAADVQLERALAAVTATACVARRVSSDELMLVSWGDGSRVFEVRGEQVQVKSRAELGRGLTLDGVARVLVVQPASAGEDLGALLVEGVPLAERVPTVYALDLCARTPREPPPERAVVVVDNPSANFDQAEAEAGIVRGYSPAAQRLLRTEATRERLSLALTAPEVWLFHYSGHARHAGNDGWDAELLLAQETHLRVPDILALPRVPAHLVLSACESGVHGADSAARTLGLGQAFVIAGADEVLVTTRAVDAARTVRLMAALYAELGTGHDLPGALRAARVRVAAEHPGDRAYLGDYRVLVP